MKCPLCDGTVVNGRCKECGMPYRKDEILYHLNESRAEHYRHASDKARKIMQAQQRAGVGNTAKSAGAGAKTAAGKKATSRTASRQSYKEQQRQIRQDAMRKMTDTGREASKTVRKSWSTAGNTTEKPKKKSNPMN